MNYNGLGDLEWGDYGRSPRFLPGWWLLPSFAIGVFVLVLEGYSVWIDMQ